MVEQEQEHQEATPQEIIGIGITLSQFWLMVGLNAFISAIISIIVLLVVGPWFISESTRNLSSNAGDTVPETASASALGNLSAPPTATPTFTPIPEPVLYEVEPGDSLSQIAERFAVPLSDIIAANNIDNPDALQTGQRLLIPIGGLIDVTPTFTPAPIPTETLLPFDPPPADVEGAPPTDVTIKPTHTLTPIPTSTAPPAGVILVEVSDIVGIGSLGDEAIVVNNDGPGVNLAGWTITGAPQGDYEFPNLFLWNGVTIRVHTRSGANTPTDLYWGLDQPLWQSGSTIQLLNAKGEVISLYTVP